MESVNSIIERDINEYGKLKKIKVVSAIDKNYLEKTYKDMAMKGWLVDAIKGSRDSYRPIEPCELEFSVTYFQPVTPLDYPDYDKEDTYQEFCEDKGWSLAAKNERCFVYYKLPENKVSSIHTEPSGEYRSIWNAMKKGELISFSILMLVILSQLWLGISNFRYENLYRPAGLLNIIYPSLFLIVVGGYMIPLISWLIKNKSRARDGKPLIYDSYNKVRLRNGLYSSGLAFIFIFIIYNTTSIFSYFFSIELLFVYLLNIVIPVGLGILLRIKIKRIKSKRSTNIIIMIVGIFVTCAIVIGATFSLVGHMDPDRLDSNIPSEIPILTHQDLGTDLQFQPRYVERYKTLMVPLSFEYESYHRDYHGDFYDIELTYIQARTEWMAEIIANRAVYDERRRIEDRMDLMLDNKLIDYVYSLNPELYGLDFAYNLSRFNTRVMLVRNNIIYFVQIDKAIDNNVLERIIPILFGESK